MPRGLRRSATVQGYNPQGAVGNAAIATAAGGQALLNAAGLQLARLLQEVSDLPLTTLNPKAVPDPQAEFNTEPSSGRRASCWNFRRQPSAMTTARYFDKERLCEIMAEFEADGHRVFDNHVQTIEDGGMKKIAPAQIDFKKIASLTGWYNCLYGDNRAANEMIMRAILKPARPILPATLTRWKLTADDKLPASPLVSAERVVSRSGCAGVLPGASDKSVAVDGACESCSAGSPHR